MRRFPLASFMVAIATTAIIACADCHAAAPKTVAVVDVDKIFKRVFGR